MIDSSKLSPLAHTVHPCTGAAPVKVKSKPSLLPDASKTARNNACADDVSMLVASSAEVVEVSKEIENYMVKAGAKINHRK